MKRSILGMVLLALAAIWVAGCGGGGGGSAANNGGVNNGGVNNGGNNNGGNNNGGTTVTAVSLAAGGPTNLLLGQTVQLTPTARDANNNPVTLPASNFTYTSSSAPNASVSGTGLVTALICPNPAQPVVITVTESSSGLKGTLPITVAIASGGTGPHTVVYTSDRDGIIPQPGFPKTTNIYTENLDNGVITQLTHNEGNGSAINASPCPDGTKIAFASNRTGNYEIYVMNADGSNVLPVTSNGATNEIPRFSADSMKIIFASSKDKSGTGATQDNNGRDLYTASIPTGAFVPAATRLTTTGDGVFNIDPQYSPDNTKIAFAVRPAGSLTEDIFLMNANGTGVQQLTNYGAVTRWPQYSPDGTQIVYISNGGVAAGRSNINIMNSNGSGQHTLFADPALALQPAFLPDGTIVYASTRSGSSRLYLLNANGTSADATPAGVRLQSAGSGASNESFPHVRTCP